MGVPEAFIDDVEDVDERSRLEVEDGWTLMILRIPFKSVDTSIPFITVPLGIIVKEDMFVTVCYYETEMIPDFIITWFVKTWKLPIIGILFSVCFFLPPCGIWNTWNKSTPKCTWQRSNWNVPSGMKNSTVAENREIIGILYHFFAWEWQLVDQNEDLESAAAILRRGFGGGRGIELRQAQDSARIYSDILSGTMDAYASVISNNLNIVMKRMTSISIILMLPTLIASLYGMNVPNSLEENPYGFLIVIVISILFSVFGFIVFKWRHWF